jgi:hypothetical protein
MSSPLALRTGIWILLSALLLPVAGGVTPLSAAPAPISAPNAEPNPCENERYKALLPISFGTMGDSEYGYFLDLDKKCREYQRVHAGDAFKVCEHARYAELLKAKPLKDMTKREYTYFIEVDRECAVWKETAVAPQPQPQPPPERKSSFTITILTGLLVLGATIANLVASLR